jgi:hypothetical protein
VGGAPRSISPALRIMSTILLSGEQLPAHPDLDTQAASCCRGADTALQLASAAMPVPLASTSICLHDIVHACWLAACCSLGIEKDVQTPACGGGELASFKCSCHRAPSGTALPNTQHCCHLLSAAAAAASTEDLVSKGAMPCRLC